MPRDGGWDANAARAVQARNAPSQAALPLGNQKTAVKNLPPGKKLTDHSRFCKEDAPVTVSAPQTRGRNQQRLQPDAEGWYELVIPGEPVPKGRVRARMVTPKGRKPFVTLYTPAETESAEKAIAAWWTTMGGPHLHHWRIHAELLFFQTPQKNGLPTHEDVDNLAKLVLDALNGVAYVDDRRVRRLVAEKLEDEHNPRTVIRLRVAPL